MRRDAKASLERLNQQTAGIVSLLSQPHPNPATTVSPPNAQLEQADGPAALRAERPSPGGGGKQPGIGVQRLDLNRRPRPDALDCSLPSSPKNVGEGRRRAEVADAPELTTDAPELTTDAPELTADALLAPAAFLDALGAEHRSPVLAQPLATELLDRLSRRSTWQSAAAVARHRSPSPRRDTASPHACPPTPSHHPTTTNHQYREEGSPSKCLPLSSHRPHRQVGSCLLTHER